ncbi:hypothetical protein BCR36DRAFT_321909 [Piromyces finnis]|uniref:SAC3/GANP/THP3 conserved domain-containing protein n=1 Tax=Piromyces finnis TaxID=1754191 RepID=A0A1Y1VG43_9FUNG|nr:hypothetical protein BCR36DRAFT_321909 [Piromyces finnis]|eukprot:ORX54691.1 hypothetical protein BCR36DRAFT_321909 [Piromyces finnis]
MQQQPTQPQRRLQSAFQNEYGNKNQKRTGNGPPSQYQRGANNKKKIFKKKQFNNPHYNQSEKNTDSFPSYKGKGPRPKFFPNKTLINKKKNFNGTVSNNKNEIEEIEFSFRNAQPTEMSNNVEIDLIPDMTNSGSIQNNISEKELREQRFSSNPFGAQYFNMKKKREYLRKEYISKGLIDDPKKPRKLEDAIPFVGDCQDMCPEFERYEREYQKNLDKLEINQENSTDEIFYVDHKKAVKRYQRSDAGKEQPLPCDVRPPPILKKTLNYLIDEIIMKHGIEDTHGFVRDRTRSIRQDFSLQNIRDKSAVDAHERIARYHILCLHQLCEKEGFSVQQEKEQLFKVLQSLQEFYDEGQENNISYPNEAEFRAYYIISHIFDNEIIRKAESYPKEILFHPYVQLALEFQFLTDEGIYSRLFKKIFSTDTPYLMGCLMEIHFNTIRKKALIAMNSAIKFKDNRLPPYPAEKLKNLLGFDTIDDLLDVLYHYGIEVESNTDNYYGIIFDKKKDIIEPEVSLTQKRVELLERKRDNKSDKEIINNGKLNDIDEPQPMFSFNQPNIYNSNNFNAFNNENKNNSIVGFSFNNAIDKMEDSNMSDINMETNSETSKPNNQNSSIFPTPIANNSISNKDNNNNNNNNTFKSTPFVFKNDSINSSKIEAPTFSFSSADKNTSPTNNTSLNQKPTFTFGSNKTTTIENKSVDNSKTGLFNTIPIQDKDTTVKKETSTELFGSKLKQNNTISFSFPDKLSDENKNSKKIEISNNYSKNENKNSLNVTNTSIPGTIPSFNFNVNSKNTNTDNKSLFSSIPNPVDSNKVFNVQEKSTIDSIINNEKIKKESEQQFINNEIKRKKIMQTLSFRNHNMNIRPKLPLDDAIVKEMKKRKELEEESKLLYNDLIKSNTENIINKAIQEEALTQLIYSDVVFTLIKEILDRELYIIKKDNQLLNNYYDALDLSTNDIIRSVVINEFEGIIKSEYELLLKKHNIRKLASKKAQLKRQKACFDEIIKYQRMKQLFSKWNHLAKLKINERRIKEENIRIRKLEFDNKVKLVEIGPGINNQIKKKNEFIFKIEQNINNKSNMKNNDDDGNNNYLDYDYEEENDKKFILSKKTHINIKDIAINSIRKQSLKNINDSTIYLKIMTSLPNNSRKSTLWTNSQFKIGPLENNIINLSKENENCYYSIDDNIHFSQNKLNNEKNLTILIQNIPYIIDNKMDWDDNDSEKTKEENNNDSSINEYYSSAAFFQLSVFNFQIYSNPEEVANYWNNERKRLELFLHRIRNCSNIPLILLYWKLPQLNSQQFVDDATYYLRLNQFFNEYNVQQNYQFLSIPFNNKNMITSTDALNFNQYISNIGVNDTTNKVEKLNIGLTWLIENSQIYTLSSQVMKEIIQNNFYVMFLNTILKPIESEIPYGIVPIENPTWFIETVNMIIQSYNYILTAMIEFLYSSQVQYISLKKEEEHSSKEYEDTSESLSSYTSNNILEDQHWFIVFETLKNKINQYQLPTMVNNASHKIQNEETLLKHFNYYLQSIDMFKSRQKSMIFIEIQKVVQSFIFNSNSHKFPYQAIFNIIVKQALNNLQEVLSDYEIYFIKYNITQNTEEISFFENLLERYKNSLYKLLNQWSNSTLSQIENVYFNEQNKRVRDNMEDSWHEISKKYQRTENNKSNSINKVIPHYNLRKKKEKTSKTIKETPKDLKKEQKLLKDLINSVKKEFPYLKN